MTLAVAGINWLPNVGKADEKPLTVIEGGAGTPPTVDEFTAEIKEFDGLPAKRTRARAVVTIILAAGPPEHEIQQWRDVMKDEAGLTGKDFDALRAAARRDAKRTKKVSQDGAIEQAIVLASPSAPERVARELLDTLPSTDGVPHRAWWEDDFYMWSGTRWEVLPGSVVQHWVYAQTSSAAYWTDPADGEPVLKWWNPNRSKVENVAHALGVGVVQRFGGPDEAVAFTNGVLDLGTRRLVPHHPERFNLYSLPFAHDPDAPCGLWLEFLRSILPGDDEQDAVDFLQEWFGYVISGRNDLEKMASFIGAKRCGKGTLAKVLAAMIGPEYVAGPQLSDLAGPFGKEDLIGKQLVIMGDVRWTGKASTEAVPVLLGITGRDHGTVHRKNRSAWNGSLGVRFLVMSNDEPKFTDASGALASRMIHVEFHQTFYGRERIGLAEQLMTELPGILNWALKGLDRLNENGKFTVPASSINIEKNIKRTSAPADAFIEDRCELIAGEMTSLGDLYTEWQKWCRTTGRPEAMMNEDSLSAALSSALRGRPQKVHSERRQVNRVRTTWFVGLKLHPTADRSWLANDQS